MTKLKLFTDGGARGNPGPAGIGAAIFDMEDNLIGEHKQYIGKATNNQAEYKALILGLEKVLEMGVKNLECYLDSELVVKQVRREYKVKNKALAPLFVKVWNLSQQFKSVSFKHVRREYNKEADRLVNEAIDEKVSSIK